MSDHVKKVVKAKPHSTHAEAKALAWLDEAVDSLERRNAVLHSELGAFWWGDNPPPSKFDWELRLMNVRRGTSVAFTPAGLETEQSHLDGILAIGYSVDGSLAAERSR